MSLSGQPLVARCCLVLGLASLTLVGPTAAAGHRCELETLKEYCLSYGECQWNWAGYCDPPPSQGVGVVAGSTATPAPSTPLGVPANDSTACNTTQRLVESVVPGCQFCENVQADQVCRVRGCVWSVPLKHFSIASFGR